MPSLNHSYICFQIFRQLLQNENIYALPELTLDIANELTSDISIFPKEQIRPNFFHDISRFQQMPTLAIEVMSSSQTVQELLEKSSQMVEAGIKTVWIVEPYSRTVFVTTHTGKQLFHEEVVESEGIKTDFAKVFE
ncbi:Uma2 family endonuclease [Candidatus Poribacteria bacterium]|nr:Uma2 family endonuclease [Candidatus Poribacteria bacterium]